MSKKASAPAAAPQSRLAARIAKLEEHLAELRSAPEPDEIAIRDAERVLSRWQAEEKQRAELEKVSEPAPDSAPADPPAA